MARRSRKKRPRRSDQSLFIETDPPLDDLALTYLDMAEQLTDFRPVFRSVAPDLARGLGDNLRSAGQALGESWPGVDTDPGGYGERKAREGFGDRELVRTGDMLTALENSQIINIGKFSMSVGIKGTMAARSIGTEFGFRKGPRPRPHVGFNRTMTRQVIDATQLYVDRVLEESTR